ncbi:hypothetical protein JHK85_005443 [Glycine max]|nr:hypothetical protein JHK87_005108 [Glycine soja]KAG5064260.1 hypothetical protein JHK85_005443 [Glycine max]KAH1061870.1 hypothetical protein GYH30_005061 [Glycine max]
MEIQQHQHIQNKQLHAHTCLSCFIFVPPNFGTKSTWIFNLYKQTHSLETKKRPTCDSLQKKITLEPLAREEDFGGDKTRQH